MTTRAREGSRLNWRMADQATPSFEKLLSHSRQPGIIRWEEVDGGVAVLAVQPDGNPVVLPPFNNHAPNDPVAIALLSQVPLEGEIEKQQLLLQANQRSGIGINRLRPKLAELTTAGHFTPFQVERAGIKKAVMLRRVQPPPQPAPQPPAVQPHKEPSRCHDHHHTIFTAKTVVNIQ